ncbi:hypothetical protein FIBSPDRAFT_938863, partial [Athelia psychrophila]
MQQVAFNMPPRKAPPFQYAHPQRSDDDALARNFPRAFTGEGHTDQTSLTAYRTKLCRYHQAGFCRAGLACPFLHTPQDHEARAREALSYSSGLQPNVRSRPSIAIPPVQYPVYTGYPYTQTWSPHTGLSAQPQAQPQGHFQLGVPPNVGPVPYLDPYAYYYYSNPSVSPNSAIDELTTPLDESRLVAEPPLGHPPYPLFASTSNLGYRQPNAPPSNYQVDRFGYPTVRPPGRTNQQRSASAPLSRKRIASYKTKPCKFWGRDGTCPNGPQCTFLHDEIASGQLDSAEAASPSSSSADRSGQPPAELPRKPLSVIEEKKSQGIYPISWRVIGGGVMMGGSREICRAFTAGQCNKGDECPFTHEVEYDSIGEFIAWDLPRLLTLTINAGHYAPVTTTLVPGPYTHLQIPRSMAQTRIEEPPQRLA